MSIQTWLSTFNVLRLTVLLIAISDDELILTNHLCSAFVFYSTQLIFKLQEVNKEINKEYYKLVACQILTFQGSTYSAVVPLTAIGFSKPH